jgi:integrase
MPYSDVPAFFQSLARKEAMAARALEFLILTAARTGEVLGATWDEMDLEEKLWTIPGARMKAGREHRVPLSEPAVDMLASLNNARISDYVFPGFKAQAPPFEHGFAEAHGGEASGPIHPAWIPLGFQGLGGRPHQLSS